MALDDEIRVQQQVQQSILGATQTGEKVVNAELEELNMTIQNTQANNAIGNTMTVDDVLLAGGTGSKGDGTSQTANEQADADPNSYAYQKLLAEKYTQDYDDLMSNQGLLPAKEQYIQKDQPIRVGQYTGKIIGSVPIFAAPMPLFPANIMKHRQNELAKAAAARRKIANQVGKALQINVPEQFQKEMDDERGNLIQKYSEVTGNRFDMLMDFNNPLSQKFWAEADALHQIDQTVTDGDKLAEDVLKDFGKKGGKYYPDAIMESALDVRGGALNVKELMKPEGMKKWRENQRTLQGYTSMISVLDPVVTKIQKNVVPMINGGDISAEDLQTFRDAYASSETGDKTALFQAIRKFVPEEDIDDAVRVVMENSNVYMGAGDEEQREKIMDDAYTYVAAMVGEELKTTIQIYDKKRARGTSVHIHNPKKEKDTPYGDMRNEWNDSYESAFTQFSPDVAGGIDATTFKFNAGGKAAYRNATNMIAKIFKMPVVEDGSGKMKLAINFGGGLEKFDMKQGDIAISGGKFNGNSAYETILGISKKSPPYSVADKGAFQLITGSELTAQKNATDLLDVTNNTFKDAEGMRDRLNDSDIKVLRQELVLTHNGTDIDEEYIGTIYGNASNAKSGTAEEKAIAGQNAVTEMYRTTAPVTRLYMQPIRDVLTYTKEQEEVLEIAKKESVDIDKLMNGNASEQQIENAKFKDAVKANLYREMIGADGAPDQSGKTKRKTRIDENYAGVGWTQDYPFSEDYAITGLDTYIGATGVGMYTKTQLKASAKNTSTNTSGKKIIIKKKNN